MEQRNEVFMKSGSRGPLNFFYFTRPQSRKFGSLTSNAWIESLRSPTFLSNKFSSSSGNLPRLKTSLSCSSFGSSCELSNSNRRMRKLAAESCEKIRSFSERENSAAAERWRYVEAVLERRRREQQQLNDKYLREPIKSITESKTRKSILKKSDKIVEASSTFFIATAWRKRVRFAAEVQADESKVQKLPFLADENLQSSPIADVASTVCLPTLNTSQECCPRLRRSLGNGPSWADRQVVKLRQRKLWTESPLPVRKGVNLASESKARSCGTYSGWENFPSKIAARIAERQSELKVKIEERKAKVLLEFGYEKHKSVRSTNTFATAKFGPPPLLRYKKDIAGMRQKRKSTSFAKPQIGGSVETERERVERGDIGGLDLVAGAKFGPTLLEDGNSAEAECELTRSEASSVLGGENSGGLDLASNAKSGPASTQDVGTVEEEQGSSQLEVFSVLENENSGLDLASSAKSGPPSTQDVGTFEEKQGLTRFAASSVLEEENSEGLDLGSNAKPGPTPPPDRDTVEEECESTHHFIDSLATKEASSGGPDLASSAKCGPTLLQNADSLDEEDDVVQSEVSSVLEEVNSEGLDLASSAKYGPTIPQDVGTVEEERTLTHFDALSVHGRANLEGLDLVSSTKYGPSLSQDVEKESVVFQYENSSVLEKADSEGPDLARCDKHGPTLMQDIGTVEEEQRSTQFEDSSVLEEADSEGLHLASSGKSGPTSLPDGNTVKDEHENLQCEVSSLLGHTNAEGPDLASYAKVGPTSLQDETPDEEETGKIQREISSVPEDANEGLDFANHAKFSPIPGDPDTISINENQVETNLVPADKFSPRLVTSPETLNVTKKDVGTDMETTAKFGPTLEFHEPDGSANFGRTEQCDAVKYSEEEKSSTLAEAALGTDLTSPVKWSPLSESSPTNTAEDLGTFFATPAKSGPTSSSPPEKSQKDAKNAQNFRLHGSGSSKTGPMRGLDSHWMSWMHFNSPVGYEDSIFSNTKTKEPPKPESPPELEDCGCVHKAVLTCLLPESMNETLGNIETIRQQLRRSRDRNRQHKS